ncbi:MAG: adaptor protein MecA [Clostridia bacterium]|nr:adaptor protein MecA [Clostridia bacterium]
MFIEQLDQNKIKVTVNATEQEEYGVTYESMTYSDGNTRRLCERIMEKAKREIGFNVNGAKLLVEARKSTDGSVTLFLSKIITSENEKDELFGQTVKFETFDDMVDCCNIFDSLSEDIATVDSYILSGKFYLYFEILCKKNRAAGLLRSVLEYGEKSHVSKEILCEHGKRIDI